VVICVLRRIAVLDEQGKPVPGLRQHAGGLLAYLAIHRTGADKADIMEALWPEASPRRAAGRLSTTVSACVDGIAHLHFLPGRDDVVRAVGLEPEQVLQPVVAVETVAVGAELHDPRPHPLGYGVDRDRASQPCRGVGDELITGKRGSAFRLRRAPLLLPGLDPPLVPDNRGCRGWCGSRCSAWGVSALGRG
jgi:hypothetical protein